MRSALLILFLSAGMLVSQDRYYPFAIDQDGLTGAPDFSNLNHPLTAADRLFVRDGHFYRFGPDLQPNTGDDERVRLFGVNLAFGANFPAGDDAVRIAKRLRRLGVNVVRLHHMDSQPDNNPNNAGSILTTGPYPTLNPVAVARLRTFLNALRAEGIYADLNLHVGYTFRPAVDRVPELENGMTFPSQSKPLQMVLPELLDKQQQFARTLIGELGLQGDPVLGLVEINNESSLLSAWQTNQLDQYLTADYAAYWNQNWNSFLRGRYTSTSALQQAWGATEPDGPDLLNGQWSLEVHVPAQATLSRVIESDTPVTLVAISRGGAPVIAKQVGFSVSANAPYVAEVEMRAELPNGVARRIYWDIKQDVSPWRTEAGMTISVTNQWQHYRMAFQPSFAMDRIGRVGLSVENVDGLLSIRNCRLYPAGRRGLSASESLDNGTVAPVRAGEFGTIARTNDYLLFLADRDRHYLQSLLGAIRAATDVLVPVAGTQVGYGGLLNFDSHAGLDFADNHFYIDHYSFLNVAWDGRDWRIRDTDALATGLSAYLGMAVSRAAGLPYTVSEFNQPWPNTHSAALDPTLSVFAAFQDWDAIMHFAYSHGRNWDDGVPNGFNMNGDWTKFPGFGQAAWLFRSGAIQTGQQPVEVPVSSEDRLRAGRERRNGDIAGFLAAAFGFRAATAFTHPVRLSIDGASAVSATPGAVPYQAGTADFSYDPEQGLFTLQAPLAAGVFGQLGNQARTAGPLTVEPAASGRGYVAVLATALDGRPLSSSSQVLLSNPGYTLRSQPGIAPVREQALVKYPGTTDWWTLEQDRPEKPAGNLNGGVQPVWMQRVECYVTLQSNAPTIMVFPLDGGGNRQPALSGDDVQSVSGGFRIHLQGEGQALSPWYEIVDAALAWQNVSFDRSAAFRAPLAFTVNPVTTPLAEGQAGATHPQQRGSIHARAKTSRRQQ